VHIGEDVTEEEDAVGFAPECEMTEGMAGCMEGDEASGDFITLADGTRDGVTRSGPDVCGEAEEPGKLEAIEHDRGIFRGGDVQFAAPEGDAAGLADGRGGALMVGVGVGEEVSAEGAAADAAHEAMACETGSGIEQDIADEVLVEGEPWPGGGTEEEVWSDGEDDHG
jgi:hypothetical protein